jgi:hypothetical protein
MKPEDYHRQLWDAMSRISLLVRSNVIGDKSEDVGRSGMGGFNIRGLAVILAVFYLIFIKFVAE